MRLVALLSPGRVNEHWEHCASPELWVANTINDVVVVVYHIVASEHRQFKEILNFVNRLRSRHCIRVFIFETFDPLTSLELLNY